MHCACQQRKILVWVHLHRLAGAFFAPWLDKYQNLMCSGEADRDGGLKIGKTKVLKTDGSLMQVESIAECSLGAFCNTFDLQ